jgi:eukaryotic-like serine/threonine-protein kinase
VPESLTQIGKYRIERELGRGGMGVVYQAFDPVVERTLAIKTIRLDVENPADLVERLKREAKSVGQLEHPNIVTLYDAGEAEGLFYLAMQFIQGETLLDRINRQKWFAWKEVLDLMRQICAGLGYAHQRGIVHRDIKPANIMITTEGVVKLTDFGIAKLVDTGTSSSGMVVGTPSYMSPEQALGRPVDARSDIFSLGSILYELTASEKAFPGQNATTVIYKIVHESPIPVTVLQPGLDPALDAIVLRALEKSPEHRFASCNELAQALESYSSGMAATMRKTAIMPSPWTSQGVPGEESRGPSVPAKPSAHTLETPTPVPEAWPATGRIAEPSAPPAVKSRSPLMWLGAGALGAVLIVVAVLLTLRVQRPAASPETSAPATVTPGSATTSAPRPPTVESPPKAAETSQPPASQAAQPASPKAEPATPRGVESTPSRQPTTPADTRTSRHASESNKTASESSTSSVRRQKPAAVPQPETYESLIVAGDMAFQQGHYQAAVDAYKKAYALNPGSVEAKRKIVVALTLLGHPEEAQKYQ